MSDLKSNYPRSTSKLGKSAKQLSGLVDAYFTFFWTHLPIVFLFALWLYAFGFRHVSFTFDVFVFGYFCIAFPLLLSQIGPLSPISKFISGLSSAPNSRAVGWFAIFLVTIAGLGFVIPFALHLATFITLRRNGINLHPLGFNRRQIYAQVGSLGAREILEESQAR